ncbi:MAG: CBS domain-containing protein [Actinobacteria bacterium]|nr:CBS domain-containing protein [Actinomycetota bacterium]
MKVSAILDHKGNFVASITPHSSVTEALRMLAVNGVGALVVSDDGQTIIGIISERDIVRQLHDDAGTLTMRVHELMTLAVHTTKADCLVDTLMREMTDRRIRHVPVVDDNGHMVGIVSIGDAVKARLGELEGERSALIGYITTGG